METVDNLLEKITQLSMPLHRGKLLARGLARGMIWSDGQLPLGSPAFSVQLTPDLLDHGFRILDAALRLREISPDSNRILDRSLSIAGEAIESATLGGDPLDSQRGFHLACAAASFHIGHFAARAYCLLRGDLDRMNLSSPERLLCILMRRELSRLALDCISWLSDPEHSDERLAARLLAAGDDFGPEDALFMALTNNFCRAIAAFEFGLRAGNPSIVRDSIARMSAGITASAETGHVPMWWIYRLASHLLDDLWKHSYHVRLPVLPSDHQCKWNDLRQHFIDLLGSRNLAHIDLWPSQLAAADRSVNTADDLVVALPTSSGKTRIAELCILRCLADQKRVVYVTPLRALSAQVENTLADTFLPLGFSTTSVYGASGIAVADVETLRSGDIVVATPEKLDFAIRQDPDVIADVGLIVLDEGHMIGLGEREIRYETLVQRLLRRQDAEERRIVCLSAIFSSGPSFDAFTDWIRSGQPGEAIRSVWRPTRQRRGELVWRDSAARLEYFVEGENVFVPRFIESIPPIGRKRRSPFPNDRNELIVASVATFAREGRSVLVYCPIRTSVETLAAQFIKSHKQGYFTPHLDEQNRSRLTDAERIGREWLGPEHPAVVALNIGIAVHHGQLPRPFLREIEKLLKNRILSIAISSPTLAQGVDLAFEVLIFSSLWRNREIIPASEFANAIGRVGRAHVTIDGIYILPVFDKDASKRATRIREYRELDEKAMHRQLESGILQLLQLLLTMLAEKLQVARSEVAEYVLNNHASWDNAVRGTDETTQSIGRLINELDNTILSTIQDLDSPVERIADKLDEALNSSYWQKRLVAVGETEMHSQMVLLRSRARWLWGATDPSKRRGYFAAGIGYAAGETLTSDAITLGGLLRKGEEAVQIGDADSAASAAIGIGESVFRVHPFACDLPARWKTVLSNWLAGVQTSQFADSQEIAFIQDGIVYRLVWAVEALRSSLSAIDSVPDGSKAGNLALCLTYGVPCIPAALIQQAGLASRTLAMKLVKELGASFDDSKGLKDWIALVAEGSIKPELTGNEQAEWNRFVGEIKHRASGKWHWEHRTMSVAWSSAPPADEKRSPCTQFSKWQSRRSTLT